MKLTKGAEFLGKFKSSDISDRRYCTKCGSHISVDHPTLGLIDVRIGALRSFPFKPKVHLNYAETVLPMKDGLPKFKDFPARSEGRVKVFPNSGRARPFAPLFRMLGGLGVASYLLLRSDSHK